jgi:hypothetical protein
MSIDEKVRASWERFLNPETLRQNLIIASMFLAAYEILRESIIDRIKSFYVSGFDQSDFPVDPEYQTEVLSRHKSVVSASLSWLQEHEAIDEQDIQAFNNVRICRNEIGHELPKMLSEGIGPERAALFAEMVRLLRKTETWWIVNVDIPANPDFDGKEIDEAGIVPGPLISLQLMMDVALGTGEKGADWYYKEFKKIGGRV